MRAFTDWLDFCQYQKIPNCERLTQSLQFNAALEIPTFGPLWTLACIEREPEGRGST